MRTASAGWAGPACRPARGRTPWRGGRAPWRRRAPGLRRGPASRVDVELGDLLPAALELDHEAPVDRALEAEGHAAVLGHVLHEVVAVDVDLVRGVGDDPEADLVAL